MKTLPSLLPWTALVDGDDLLLINVHATCFGGKFDQGDDGRTESGVMNDGSNNLLQVALPIRSMEGATKNSPLAFKGEHIPWHTHIKVWRLGQGEDTAVTGILTDNGPDVQKYPTHAMDLNPPMALKFSPKYNPRKLANSWSMDGLCARIVGGAKYIS